MTGKARLVRVRRRVGPDQPPVSHRHVCPRRQLTLIAREDRKDHRYLPPLTAGRGYDPYSCFSFLVIHIVR
jgi:hypothetical protein